MESQLYNRLNVSKAIALDEQSVVDVHGAYVAMASRGYALDEESLVIEKAYDELIHSLGAETIILGGTDLTLVFDENSECHHILDCADVHIKAIVEQIAERA